MRRLGAILAGGAARRFGGDKGAALLDGRALIDRVADGLRGQADAVVIVGRVWPGLERVEDAPGPCRGPLGGLCGALAYAVANGFDSVISHPCDLLPVPDWSGIDLEPGRAVFADGHYVAGVWPALLGPALDALMHARANPSVRVWIAQCGARPIVCGPMADLNTREQLETYLTGTRPAA